MVRCSGHVVGVLLVLLVAMIWVAASFVVSALEKQHVSSLLITLLCNAQFVVLVPLYELIRCIRGYRRRRLQQRQQLQLSGENSLVSPLVVNDAPGDGNINGDDTFDPEQPSSAPAAVEPNQPKEHLRPPAPTSTWETPRKAALRAAVLIAPLWFSAQWTFNLSLSFTSVSSNTIISSTAGLWTLGLAMLFAGERYTPAKLAGVVLCVAGTALVSVSDAGLDGGGGGGQHDSNHSNGSHSNASNHTGGGSTVAGNALCLLSTVLYAGYTTALQRWAGDDSSCSMMLVFGYIGVVTVAAVGPLVLLLWRAGMVQTQLSARHVQWIVGKGMFDNVLSDYLWGLAVVLTTPTVASAVLNVQIPIAMAADAMLGLPSLTAETCIGATVVIGGCVLVSLWPDPQPNEAPAVHRINHRASNDVDAAASGTDGD